MFETKQLKVIQSDLQVKFVLDKTIQSVLNQIYKLNLRQNNAKLIYYMKYIHCDSVFNIINIKIDQTSAPTSV